MSLRHFLAAACFALAGAAAHAHAFLDRADPKVGSVVQVAPSELKIWFSEPLEGAFSSVQVLDQGGKRVDASAAQVDAENHQLLRVPLAQLGAGSYTVKWRAVSVDTHVSTGHFTFRVSP
jgi:methionine-rich copper-binding protein CopC